MVNEREDDAPRTGRGKRRVKLDILLEILPRRDCGTLEEAPLDLDTEESLTDSV